MMSRGNHDEKSHWTVGNDLLMSAAMVALPDPVREFLRAKLAERGLTMADVSHRIGKNRAYLQQFLERNTPRVLPEDIRESLAVILNVSPDDLRGRTPWDIRPRSPASASEPTMVPVFATTEAAPDGAFLWSDDPVDFLPRPASLKSARNVYALYMAGETMVPRYEPGQPIFMHPGRPVPGGAYVVLRTKAPDGRPLGYVRRFVKATAAKVIVEQLNPPKQSEFKLSDVTRMDRIVGSGEV